MSNITQKWVGVLIPFVFNYDKKLSGSEIARLSGIPQQTVSRVLSKVVKEGLLDYCKQGRNKLFYFNYSRQSTRGALEIIENTRSLEFAKKVKNIMPFIEESLNYTGALVVFGSFSSLKFNKDSDLDVLFLGKCNRQKLKSIKQKYPFEVNEHYSSFESFEKLLNEKNPLALEILKNHTLFGDVSAIVKLFCEVFR